MRYIILGLLFLTTSGFSDMLYWQDANSLNSLNAKLETEKVSSRMLTLDQSLFELNLSESTGRYAARGSQILPKVTLPLPNGENVILKVKPTRVMADELAAKFPEIKTYQLMPTSNTDMSGRMEVSPEGVFISLQTAGNKVFIEPDTSNSDESGRYSSSWVTAEHARQDEQSADFKQKTDYKLLAADESVSVSSLSDPLLMHRSSNPLDSTVTIYRLAISATSGYVRANGGTKASAMRAIVSTINRINQVYERDVAIRFVLVTNNDRLIAPANMRFSDNLDKMIEQNQRLVDRVIGSENYDIGHLFASRGGGLAYVKSACRSGVKAMGASGNLRVGKERYALEFVAHEIGHQFGAMHTFNGSQGLCLSSHRSSSSAFEPGSGSTIMSYAGICSGDNLQYQADAMFHVGSIQQIVAHKNSQYENGCGTALRSSNHQPEIDAGADYVIPANTPFELKGAARDMDRDILLYNWQQQDSGSSSKINVDTGNNALFRSYLPTASKQRIFPKMSVLNGTEVVRGETLPSTNRDIHFKFVAYDTMGVAITDSMIVSVVTDEKRFGLNPIALSAFVPSANLPILWQVANTDLPPISCSAVDIALSTDNGEHFNYILAKQIPNSGSATVVLPDVSLNDKPVRLKLSCSNNIFFSISQWASEPDSKVSQGYTSSVGDNYSYLSESEPTNASTRSSASNEASEASNGAKGFNGAGGSLSIYWLWMLGLCLGLNGLRNKGL